MTDQTDPISPNEIILRRIPEDWVNLQLGEPVQRVAFQPNRRDIDGISVFREFFVSPSELAAAGKNPTKGYYVAFASFLPKQRSKEIQRALALLAGRDIAFCPRQV